MLDIVHALYEQDSIPLYEEHTRIKSELRVSMWRLLYRKEYPYPYRPGQGSSPAEGLPPEESLLPPEGATKGPTKPYVPPSTTDELAQVLDAPMGG